MAVLQCVGEVRGQGQWGAFHRTRCTRTGTFEREGKMYCKQHDPVTRQERQKRNYDKWKEKFDATCDLENRKKALLRICEGLTLEEVEAKLKPSTS